MKNALTRHVDELIDLIKATYGDVFVPLHRPVFEGNEKKYLVECINSNFVSSVGERVKEFERHCSSFTGVKHTISTVNGTSALHVSLKSVGVSSGDEVITQALTFVATCNAISYCGASPVFIDVDRDTMGLSPNALDHWLKTNTEIKSGKAFNKLTGSKIAACIPMHTFGHPLRIAEVVDICNQYGIPVIEDAAEALGSYINGKHVGGFGKAATLSFNGNKVITTGGGGMILTNDSAFAKHALHLTTTAKVPHDYEFIHDEIGFNYRLPALNAALGCAQMERVNDMLDKKALVAQVYREFSHKNGINFVEGMEGARPNFWLNAIITNSKNERNKILKYMNAKNVMVRPIWRLMNSLDIYKHCATDELKNSRWLEERVINLPSSVPLNQNRESY
jgi:perosamine synthetase